MGVVGGMMEAENPSGRNQKQKLTCIDVQDRNCAAYTKQTTVQNKHLQL